MGSAIDMEPSLPSAGTTAAVAQGPCYRAVERHLSDDKQREPEGHLVVEYGFTLGEQTTVKRQNGVPQHRCPTVNTCTGMSHHDGTGDDLT